jgi:hypothetical protein
VPWLRVPLIPLAVAFAAGIALAEWTSARVLWPVALAAVVLAAPALVLRRQRVAAALLLIAAAAVGALRAATLPLPADHIARLDLPRSATVT